VTLPFTEQQFFDLFRSYNQAVWPAPLVLTILAIVVAIWSLSSSVRAHSAALLPLAFMWLWTALAYHFAFFSRINPAARAFGVLWFVGAVHFARRALRTETQVRSAPSVDRVAGTVLMLYALLLYPLLGTLGGHSYPAIPTFGTPCPVAILTLGVLLLVQAPPSLFIVPLLWSAIGGSAAFLLGVPQDLGLIVAGILTCVLVIRSRTRRASAT
jgi:hypothetical protein